MMAPTVRQAMHVQGRLSATQGTILQRKCSCGKTPESGGECTECKTKRSEGEWKLQRFGVAVPHAEFAPPIVHEVLQSSGRPLDSEVRSALERRFGNGFSHVRVHTDAKADESANAVNAEAYTVGSHVVFAAGNYAPSTADGFKLLAHELTHVIQQDGNQLNHTGPISIDSATSDQERAAEQVASSMSSPPELLFLGNDSRVLTAESRGIALQRQTTGSGGPPGNDPCRSLLDEILALLEEVAQRFNDAVNDRHGLFEHHRTIQDSHPDHGSWEGHQRRHESERRRLEDKVDQWDNDNNCRQFRLQEQEVRDLVDAREFSRKPFPHRPAPSMKTQSNEESLRPFLPNWVIPTVISAGVAALIVACFVTGVCQISIAALGLGAAATAAVLLALKLSGVRDSSDGGPNA